MGDVGDRGARRVRDAHVAVFSIECALHRMCYL
jgi:hypothetical protein